MIILCSFAEDTSWHIQQFLTTFGGDIFRFTFLHSLKEGSAWAYSSLGCWDSWSCMLEQLRLLLSERSSTRDAYLKYPRPDVYPSSSSLPQNSSFFFFLPSGSDVFPSFPAELRVGPYSLRPMGQRWLLGLMILLKTYWYVKNVFPTGWPWTFQFDRSCNRRLRHLA